MGKDQRREASERDIIFGKWKIKTTSQYILFFLTSSMSFSIKDYWKHERAWGAAQS